MTRLDVGRRFALLVAFTFLAWLVMFVHNSVDSPALTVFSPENSLPALASGMLVAGWRLLPWKRAVEFALLGWALLHLIGGGVLSVLPPAYLAYEPVQTATRYTLHLPYGAAQLSLIWLLLGCIRSPRPAVARRPTDGKTVGNVYARIERRNHECCAGKAGRAGDGRNGRHRPGGGAGTRPRR